MAKPLSADFWRLWIVGFATSVVRWLEMLVIAIFVYEKTASPFLVAAMTMLRLMPMGLLGAFTGTVLERFDRRIALAWVAAGSTATSAALAALAWSGHLAVWHLGVASVLGGLSWVTDNPLRRLMMGDAVGHDRMGTAMALDTIASNVSRIAGPSLGGALLASTGITGAFVLGTVLQLAAVWAALALRTAVPGNKAAGAIMARTREGFAAAFAEPRLRTTLLLTMLFNLFGWPCTSMVPVIGKDSLGLGPEGVGVLSSLEGVGAFAAAVLLARYLAPAWHGRIYVGGIGLFMAASFAFAMAPTPLLAALAIMVSGLGGAAFATLQATLVYMAAPPAVRTRVLGVLSLAIGVGPLGFMWLGWLAGRIGAPEATMTVSIMGLVGLAALFPLWRRM